MRARPVGGGEVGDLRARPAWVVEVGNLVVEEVVVGDLKARPVGGEVGALITCAVGGDSIVDSTVGSIGVVVGVGVPAVSVESTAVAVAIGGSSVILSTL